MICMSIFSATGATPARGPQEQKRLLKQEGMYLCAPLISFRLQFVVRVQVIAVGEGITLAQGVLSSSHIK